MVTSNRPRAKPNIRRASDRPLVPRRTQLQASKVGEETPPTVELDVELTMNTMTTLAIFDEEGHLVDIVFEGWLQPGHHRLRWVSGHRSGRFKCLLDTPWVRLVKYIEIGDPNPTGL